jgi:hypothetical protein
MKRYLLPCFLLAAAYPVHAVVIAGPNGAASGNTTQGSLNSYTTAQSLPAFPNWDNMVTVNGASGVYLGTANGSGWVITAAHVGQLAVGSGTINVGGTNYMVHSGQNIGTADLRLYRIGGELGDPSLPAMSNVIMATTAPSIGTNLLDFGVGARVETTANSATNSDAARAPGSNATYFEWGSASLMRWGTNFSIPLPTQYGGAGEATATFVAAGYTTNLFYSSFDDPGSPNYLTTTEAHLASGDSGGGVFALNGGNWELVGWNAYVDIDSVNTTNGQPGSTSGFGNYAFYGNLPDVKPLLQAAMVPEPSGMMLSSMAGMFLLRRRRSVS